LHWPLRPSKSNAAAAPPSVSASPAATTATTAAGSSAYRKTKRKLWLRRSITPTGRSPLPTTHTSTCVSAAAAAANSASTPRRGERLPRRFWLSTRASTEAATVVWGSPRRPRRWNIGQASRITRTKRTKRGTWLRQSNAAAQDSGQLAAATTTSTNGPLGHDPSRLQAIMGEAGSGGATVRWGRGRGSARGGARGGRHGRAGSSSSSRGGSKLSLTRIGALPMEEERGSGVRVCVRCSKQCDEATVSWWVWFGAMASLRRRRHRRRRRRRRRKCVSMRSHRWTALATRFPRCENRHVRSRAPSDVHRRKQRFRM
jgi:hypothetical protein